MAEKKELVMVDRLVVVVANKSMWVIVEHVVAFLVHFQWQDGELVVLWQGIVSGVWEFRWGIRIVENAWRFRGSKCWRAYRFW